MLTITEQASTAIQAIVGSVDAEDAGLRIFAQPTDDGQAEATLELALSEGPAAGDQIVELEDSKVYLELNAAAYLDDKVLDAQIDGENVRFSIAEKPSDLA